MEATTQRWTAPEQTKVYVSVHTGVVLHGITVGGSASAGILVQGASGFLLEDVAVSGSRADGIHMTAGTTAWSAERWSAKSATTASRWCRTRVTGR